MLGCFIKKLERSSPEPQRSCIKLECCQFMPEQCGLKRERSGFNLQSSGIKQELNYLFRDCLYIRHQSIQKLYGI